MAIEEYSRGEYQLLYIDIQKYYVYTYLYSKEWLYRVVCAGIY